jgi:RNA polymerase sigma-70 factor (ECF subfamily)
MDAATLYRTHAAEVHRFARYLSGDAALADDLTSEAFVRLWTAPGRINGSVKAYLLAIVRNLYVDWLRERRRMVELDERAPDPADRVAGPVQHRQALDRVMAELATLPEVDRAALLLRAVEALPYEEIGRVLGISVAAAKVKVHRVRLKLVENCQVEEMWK